VFSDVSFSLKKGTLTSLTGPSGCGKSTLFECLSGLKKISGGKIFCSSRPVLGLQESESSLFETYAADDVAFGAKNRGASGKELVHRVKSAMNLAGLDFAEFADRATFKLSGGEKRKLSVASLIALDAEILIFDEPTAGLDPSSRKKIISTLRALADSGKTVLFSTHRPEEAGAADENLTWENLTEKNFMEGIQHEKNSADEIQHEKNSAEEIQHENFSEENSAEEILHEKNFSEKNSADEILHEKNSAEEILYEKNFSGKNSTDKILHEKNFSEENSAEEILHEKNFSEKKSAELSELTQIKNARILEKFSAAASAFTPPAKIPPSAVSSLSAALKMILFILIFAVSVSSSSIPFCACMVLLNFLYALAAKFPFKKPLSAVAKLFPWILLFSVLGIFLFPVYESDTIFFAWKFLIVTKTKCLLFAASFLHSVCGIFCIGTFIFTTSEREIMDGLDAILSPLKIFKFPVRYVVLVVGIIFRFVPLLLDELSGIVKTQIIRGALAEAKGIKKIFAFIPIFVPLVLQTIRKAQCLAEALEARYFK
jgi:energy-coupling factor transport system ATP-binding protein